MKFQIPEVNSNGREYYRTKPLGLLGHISLGVRSILISEKFYTAILATFGITIVFSNATRTTIGYGLSSDSEPLTLFERGEGARAPGAGTHLAFNAPSRKAVREFWEAGMANGGVDEGPPGVREQYGESYYAAFLKDPDGWRVEAVFQEAIVEGEESGLAVERGSTSLDSSDVA